MVSILIVVIKFNLIGDIMNYLQLYGMNGLSIAMPLPIISDRAPLVTDKDALPGQEWVDKITGDVYIFGGIINGEGIWKSVSANAAGVFASIDVTTGPNSIDGTTEINSGTASDTTIGAGASTGNVSIIGATGTGTVTIGNANAGNISLVSGATISTSGITSINNSANFATNINTGTSTGAVTIKNSTGAGDVNIRTGSGAGDVHIADGTSAGSITIGNVNTTAVNVVNNITAGARSVNISSAGNTAAFADTVNISAGVMNNAGGSQSLNLNTGALNIGSKFVNINTGAVAAGTSTTNISSGNVAGGTHAVNISTGTGTKTVNVGNADGLTAINLISPVTIGSAGSPVLVSGAGAPGALAHPIGSLYLRTDNGGISERLYVATAVGTWTPVVTVA